MGNSAGRAKRGTLLAILTAFAATIGMAAVAPAAHAATTRRGATVSPEVEQQLGDSGRVNVVATLRTTAGSEPAPDPTTEQEWLDSVGHEAQALVDRMPAGSRTSDAPVRQSRRVALSVDAQGLDQLRADPAVESVAVNQFRQFSLAKSTKTMGAPVAWSSGYTGAGQAVAILDTGVQSSHPFFGGRVVAEVCFSGSQGAVALCNGGDPGGNTHHTEGPNSALPCVGYQGCEHGTHVAGIAAGANGPPIAPSGVAPGANIVAVKVVSKDPASNAIGAVDSDVQAGLDWVNAHRLTYNIASANMSLGSGSFADNCDSAEPGYKTAIDTFRANGVATVVASGNDGDPFHISSPACVSSAMAVGSIASETLDVSFFSNASPMLDFLAPGAANNEDPSGPLFEGVWSSVPTNQYTWEAGTSMAAPHVAGAWAVMRQAYPGISVDLAEFILKSTGRLIQDPGNHSFYPLIQLDEALPKPKGTYHPVDPVRLLDTRTGNGATKARVGAGTSIDLQVGGRGGVPSSGVSAVVLNVTYVLPTVGGFVTVWPTGALRPVASNLNLNVGDARPNLVTVRMGAGGKVSLYNEVGSVDLVADVAGWYDTDAANTGSYYHPSAPTRVLDTRNGSKVGNKTKLTIDVTNANGSPIPAGATAAIVNLTGTGATAGTYVTAYPANLPDPPVTSNLNLSPGQTRPNLAIVPLDAAGNLTLYNNAGSVDLIADVEGWYDGTPGYRFVPKTPTRILDTRFGNGGVGPLGGDSILDLQVTGSGNIPSNVAGVGDERDLDGCLTRWLRHRVPE